MRSYNQLLSDVEKAQEWLLQNNLKKQDVVALQFNHEYLFVVYFLAITSLGAIAAVLPTAMPNNLVSMVCKLNSFNMLIHSDGINCETQTIPTHNVKNIHWPTTKSIRQQLNIETNEIAAYYFTGGTVGKPKIVSLSHRNLTRGMINGAYGFNTILFQTYYSIIPFFHIFGLIRGMLTVLFTGSNNCLGSSPKNITTELPIYKPTFMIITPSLLELVCYLATQSIEAIGGKLTNVVVGGAVVGANLLAKANKLGIYTTPGYGLTESSNLVCGNRFPLKHEGSMGHQYPYQELKIVEGELWIKGENVSPGYLHDQVNNQSSYTDGWFKTGDLVKIIDEEIFIVGRIKNLIILPSGEKISPEEIENIFNNVPLVKDSLLTYHNNELIIEVFMRVVPNITFEQCQTKMTQIYEQINNTLPDFMRINKLVIRQNDFKRSPAMKILRNQNA